MFRDRSPEGAIIFWGGILILAGLILIIGQLVFEAYYIGTKVITQFTSNYIGMVVLIIGAALVAVAFVASRLRLTSGKK